MAHSIAAYLVISASANCETASAASITLGSSSTGTILNQFYHTSETTALDDLTGLWSGYRVFKGVKPVAKPSWFLGLRRVAGNEYVGAIYQLPHRTNIHPFRGRWDDSKRVLIVEGLPSEPDSTQWQLAGRFIARGELDFRKDGVEAEIVINNVIYKSGVGGKTINSYGYTAYTLESSTEHYRFQRSPDSIPPMEIDQYLGTLATGTSWDVDSFEYLSEGALYIPGEEGRIAEGVPGLVTLTIANPTNAELDCEILLRPARAMEPSWKIDIEHIPDSSSNSYLRPGHRQTYRYRVRPKGQLPDTVVLLLSVASVDFRSSREYLFKVPSRRFAAESVIAKDPVTSVGNRIAHYILDDQPPAALRAEAFCDSVAHYDRTTGRAWLGILTYSGWGRATDEELGRMLVEEVIDTLVFRAKEHPTYEDVYLLYRAIDMGLTVKEEMSRFDYLDIAAQGGCRMAQYELGLRMLNVMNFRDVGPYSLSKMTYGYNSSTRRETREGIDEMLVNLDRQFRSGSCRCGYLLRALFKQYPAYADSIELKKLATWRGRDYEQRVAKYRIAAAYRDSLATLIEPIEQRLRTLQCPELRIEELTGALAEAKDSTIRRVLIADLNEYARAGYRAAQIGLFTLLERSPVSDERKVALTVIEAMCAENDREALFKSAAYMVNGAEYISGKDSSRIYGAALAGDPAALFYLAKDYFGESQLTPEREDALVFWLSRMGMSGFQPKTRDEMRTRRHVFDEQWWSDWNTLSEPYDDVDTYWVPTEYNDDGSISSVAHWETRNVHHTPGFIEVWTASLVKYWFESAASARHSLRRGSELPATLAYRKAGHSVYYGSAAGDQVSTGVSVKKGDQFFINATWAVQLNFSYLNMWALLSDVSVKIGDGEWERIGSSGLVKAGTDGIISFSTSGGDQDGRFFYYLDIVP